MVEAIQSGVLGKLPVEGRFYLCIIGSFHKGRIAGAAARQGRVRLQEAKPMFVKTEFLPGWLSISYYKVHEVKDMVRKSHLIRNLWNEICCERFLLLIQHIAGKVWEKCVDISIAESQGHDVHSRRSGGFTLGTSLKPPISDPAFPTLTQWLRTLFHPIQCPSNVVRLLAKLLLAWVLL